MVVMAPDNWSSSFILTTVAGYVTKLFWSLLYFWTALMIYNVISAIHNRCIGRRIYIKLLRYIYKSFGSRRTTKRKVRFQDEVNDGTNNTSNGPVLSRRRSMRSIKAEFQLADVFDFVHDGVEVIIEDDVTKCFSTQELEEWNFLSRTRFKTNLGLKMEILLIMSVVFRFTIFFMIKLPIGIASFLWLLGTLVVLSIVGFFFPKANWKLKLERFCSVICCRMLAAAFSAVINIHHRENRATLGSVCVANHTTPIDIIMLAVDNSFTLVGQSHGGIVGIVQKACSLAQEHIWFERKVASDRRMVANRLKEHVSNPRNNPILIFPEGTCINNTSVFMFKKGCFELGATIYPVVIKYHREFADPYWNSQEQGMLTYIAMLMTSWAIVCDIDYLPPTELKEGETATEFANRVKADICRKGGLVDLPWDGMIKRPGSENYLKKLIEEERKAYLEFLEVNKKGQDDSSDNEDGLIMMKQSNN